MKTATYLIKAPPGMMALWHAEADRRGISLAQLIREAVNKEIGLRRAEEDDDD